MNITGLKSKLHFWLWFYISQSFLAVIKAVLYDSYLFLSFYAINSEFSAQEKHWTDKPCRLKSSEQVNKVHSSASFPNADPLTYLISDSLPWWEGCSVSSSVSPWSLYWNCHKGSASVFSEKSLLLIQEKAIAGDTRKVNVCVNVQEAYCLKVSTRFKKNTSNWCV